MSENIVSNIRENYSLTLFVYDTKYEELTAAQNVSLQWLISELYAHFNLDSADVYRHPEVSYKMASEGSTAIWK